ncbi:GNAT family N-acetyltransferase [bacterium]|nr:GNAT family N-acetyltransferase [bacterium]
MLQFENIITERLILLPLGMEYCDDIYREFDEEVALYMVPRAFSVQDRSAAEMFLKNCELANLNGTDLELAVLDKNTREFIGAAAVIKLHRRVPEIGLWVKKSAWGRGYGLETVRALIDWTFAHKAYPYILYPVDRDNRPSCLIAEACGAKEDNDYMQKSESGRTLNVIEYHIVNKNSD